MGGGIGVPPILELAKQMNCEKKADHYGIQKCRNLP